MHSYDRSHCTRFRRHNQLRKTSLKLRTSSNTPPVSFEHLRSIRIEACLWFSWLAEVQSILLACMRRQELNITSQQKYWSPSASHRVPRDQASKDKSEAKNGFNFGSLFGVNVSTELRKSFPYSCRHGP